MKKLIGSVVVLLALATAAEASTPVVGESVIYRYDSTHSYLGVISAVNGDGSVNLVLFHTGTDFIVGPNSQYAFATAHISGITEGTTDNKWAVNPDVPVQGPTGATGATGPAGAGSLVVSQSTPSLALNGSAVQFSTTADTIYSVSVKITTTLSLTGGAAGHVDMVCDASATPTTIVETVQSESTGTLTVGLNLQASNTLVLHWRVPAGHRCKLTTTNDTGTPTYSITRQLLQTLG